MGWFSIDNKMSITDDQANAEFCRLFTCHSDAAKRLNAVDSKTKLDLNSILTALGRRTKLEDALALSNKFKQMAADSSQNAARLSHLNSLIKGVKREKDKIRNYRIANADFRLLLAGYVNGEEEKNLKFCQAQADWKEFKTVVNSLPLCDEELAKEFAVLDCLFQILQYYYLRRTDRAQIAVRSKLGAVLGNKKYESVLRDDQLASAALEKLFARPFLVQGKPKEMSNQDEIDTNHSSNKKMLFKTSLSKKSGKASMRRVTFGSENRSKLSLSQPTSAQEAVSRRLCESNTASQPPASKLGQLCVIDLEEIEPKTTLKSHASLYDEARAAIKNRLFEVVQPFFNIRLARCYAQRIEADIFSLYYSDLNLYKAKGKKCAEILGALIAKQTTWDCLMTTSFDYSQLKRFSEKLIEEELEGLPIGDATLGKRNALCPEYRKGSASVSDMEPFKIGEEGLSPFDSDETDSAELLEEVAKIREREIAHYTQLLQERLKEQEELRRAIRKVSERIDSHNSRK